ncbi:hypothetical protein [Granulicella sibirica]|uniref:Uncharacterized protein n=1 Tax=Granulicella sibirica TaxID=2479048 RepID=A0A4Q0T054_9BACT|nr:hypothetical protein [Granulicella sibirica]RXH55298.1 hypothetical protein GRAN_4402 [Granulicella sibirica]
MLLEYTIPRKSYAAAQEVEVRGIVEKEMGNFLVDFNPKVNIPTTGEERGTPPTPGVDISALYKKYRFQPGIEYYSQYRQLSQPISILQKQQVLFATFEAHPIHAINWQLGVGFGLANGSDSIVLRSLTTFDFKTHHGEEEAAAVQEKQVQEKQER